ncbi:MAG: peptidylprolyl isomerase [Flavobacteriales bacterium]|jgi:peptidyl-prolyl cis-trans isomerase SurA|nr:peptidylprolyl isomerase [Flavobacteriales bacterium]
MLKAKILILGLLMSTPFVFAQNKAVIDEVIAIVGDHPVFYSDYQDQISQFKGQGTAVTQELQVEVLETILRQKLLLHKAALDSIEVNDAEIESTVNRRLEYFQKQAGGKEALEKYFKKSTKEIKEEMRKPLKDQMLGERAKFAIIDGIKQTPSQIREFFENLPIDSLPIIEDQYKIAQIIKIPEPSVDAKKEVIAKLKKFKERILSGEDMETLAILYTEDPGSSINGGLYKGIKKGMFVKEFEEVMYSLEIGQISDPFETEYGFHIVKLEGREGDVVDVRHILVSPKISEEQMQEAKAFLDSIQVRISNNDYTFEKAAQKFSDDKITKNNGGLITNPQTGGNLFEKDKMDNLLKLTLKDLGKGEVSKVSFVDLPNKKRAYRILSIREVVPAHTLNLKDDYLTIQRMSKMNEENKKLANWMKTTIKDIYINLKPQYQDWNFELNWTKK